MRTPKQWRSSRRDRLRREIDGGALRDLSRGAADRLLDGVAWSLSTVALGRACRRLLHHGAEPPREVMS